MMFKRAVVRGAVASLAVGLAVGQPGTADAHHSFAMFDGTKRVLLVGTLKEVRWTNPHSWIFVSVPQANGPAQVWAIEGAAPTIMARAGLKRSDMAPGAKVKVMINPLRDGRLGGSFLNVTFADGRKFGSDNTLGADLVQKGNEARSGGN